MSCRTKQAAHAVNDFFGSLGDIPEETLATYLISTLEDSAPDAVDLLELQDIVAGFCPSFDAVPDAQKLALLSTLVQKVRRVCWQACVSEATLLTGCNLT